MRAADIRPPFQLGPLGRTVAPFMSAAIVLIFGVLAYRGVQNTVDAERLVAHTHQVIEANGAVLARARRIWSPARTAKKSIRFS